MDQGWHCFWLCQLELLQSHHRDQSEYQPSLGLELWQDSHQRIQQIQQLQWVESERQMQMLLMLLGLQTQMKLELLELQMMPKRMLQLERFQLWTELWAVPA
jgi:hypothetical protein